MPPKDMLLAVDSTISKRGHSVSIAVRHGLVDTGVVDTLAEGQRKSQMIYRNVKKKQDRTIIFIFCPRAGGLLALAPSGLNS